MELLKSLDDHSFSKEGLIQLKSIIDANNSDLFDVLEYVSFANSPMTREDRVSSAKSNIYNFVNEKKETLLTSSFVTTLKTVKMNLSYLNCL